MELETRVCTHPSCTEIIEVLKGVFSEPRCINHSQFRTEKDWLAFYQPEIKRTHGLSNSR